MRIDMRDDRGWLVVELTGDAGGETDGEWTAFRAGFPWERASNADIDVASVGGASDRMVESLIGLTADAHHRGGKVVVVGVRDELAARIVVLGMEGYITTAMSIEQARTTLHVV